MGSKKYTKLDDILVLVTFTVGGLVMTAFAYELIGIEIRPAGMHRWGFAPVFFGGAILINLLRYAILLITEGPKRWIETMVIQPGFNGFFTGVGLVSLYMTIQMATGRIEILGGVAHLFWVMATIVTGSGLGIVLWIVLVLIRHRFMSYRRDNGVFIQASADGSIRSGDPLWGKDAAWCAIPDITVQPGKDHQFTVMVLIKSKHGVVTTITPVTLTVHLPDWEAAGRAFNFAWLDHLGVTEHTGIKAWFRATFLAEVAANRTTDLALDARIADHRETGRREELETALTELLKRLGYNKQLPPGFGPFDIRVGPSYTTTRT